MRLRVSIVASIIALLLGAFSIGGATMAWFTAGSDTMENTFTAGTVSFGLGGPIPGTEVDGCLPVEWQIAYTGSKQAYLRVRPVVEAEGIETIYIAIRLVSDRNVSYWAVGEGQYFIYELNTYTATDKYVISLQEGNNQRFRAEIWDDGNTLAFSFVASLPNNYIRSINIYVGVMPPPSTDPDTFPYRLPETGIYDPPLQSVDYSIPFTDFIGMPGGSVDVQLCNQIDLWVMGNDGWWYYNGVVDPDPVEQIGVCFKFCVNPGYTGNISYYLEAEAVQASHGAIEVLWPDRGWTPPVP